MALISRRTASMGLLLPLLASRHSRAQELKVDLGEAIKAILDFAKYLIDRSDRASEPQREALAAIGARMARIAAIKREFAKFLHGKPKRISEFAPADKAAARAELKALDDEIKALVSDLKKMDPTWSANHPRQANQLFRIGHGKNIEWFAMTGPQGGGVNTSSLREWLVQEADALEKGAEIIADKLK